MSRLSYMAGFRDSRVDIWLAAWFEAHIDARRIESSNVSAKLLMWARLILTRLATRQE
jgi:hypothetical protein